MSIRPTTNGYLFAGELHTSEISNLIMLHSFHFKFLSLSRSSSYDSKATYEPSWRTDVCMTENLMDNLTRCMCPISGTFVVLFVKKNFNVSPRCIELRKTLIAFFCFISSSYEGLTNEASERTNDRSHLLRLLFPPINHCICRPVTQHLHTSMLH